MLKRAATQLGRFSSVKTSPLSFLPQGRRRYTTIESLDKPDGYVVTGYADHGVELSGGIERLKDSPLQSPGFGNEDLGICSKG